MRTLGLPKLPVAGAFAILLGLAAIGPGALPSGADAVRPGDPVTVGHRRCRAGFVLADDAATYLAVAGHCGDEGDRVHAAGGDLGTVVHTAEAQDLALVEVADHRLDDLAPAVAGHPEAPTSVATVAGTRAGDAVVVAAGSSWSDRSGIEGTLIDHTVRTYCADASAGFGDSGGPVIHEPTGAALGLVNRVGGVCPTQGVSAAAALAGLRAAGFDVELLTV